MTNYLFNKILSYHNTPLSPLFTSFSPDIQAEVIRAFFGDADADIFFDPVEGDIKTALSYIQDNISEIVISSKTTGEILMRIPVSKSNNSGLKTIGFFL